MIQFSEFKTVQNNVTSSPFSDPDPFNELRFENAVRARLEISNYLGYPLATLEQTDRDVIETIISKSLEKEKVMTEVKQHFSNKGGNTCKSK